MSGSGTVIGGRSRPTATGVQTGAQIRALDETAWPLWGILLAVASLLTVRRLRSSSVNSRGTRRASDWLLVAAWPIGIALAILLSQLHVGPLDEDGDYPVSTGIGFGGGALLFAASLLQLGRELRGPVEGLPRP